MPHAILCARVGSTRGTDLGPGPGLAAACRAARMHVACISLHASFSACFMTMFPMCMQHAMPKNCVAASQDSISGPTRSTCVARV